jgi:zinc protease
VIPLIERAFGPIVSRPAPDEYKDREQTQLGERRVVVQKEARLASVIKAYHVPNLTDPDSYALEVMEALLSAGESSRLTRTLVREKQLALSADAENRLISKDPNLFALSADVMPGKTVEQVETALVGEIEALQRSLVGAKELEKAKNQLESAFIFAQDSLFYQGMLLARYEVVSSWKDADKYVPSVRAVSAEDVKRVARKYLVPSNCTTGVLMPIPSTKRKPLEPGSPAGGNIVR